MCLSKKRILIICLCLLLIPIYVPSYLRALVADSQWHLRASNIQKELILCSSLLHYLNVSPGLRLTEPRPDGSVRGHRLTTFHRLSRLGTYQE